jgi:hypothetical protein
MMITVPLIWTRFDKYRVLEAVDYRIISASALKRAFDQSRFAFAAVLHIFPGWFEWKIRGHEQRIHPHRRRA